MPTTGSPERSSRTSRAARQPPGNLADGALCESYVDASTVSGGSDNVSSGCASTISGGFLHGVGDENDWQGGALFQDS